MTTELMDGLVDDPVVARARVDSFEEFVLATGDRSCESATRAECTWTTLANGDVVRTSTVARTPGEDGVHRMAVLVSPARHLRVAVVSTNMDWDERVTRPDAVLSLGQLREIVTMPWWGFRLPEEYADAGRRLRGYRDVSDLSAASGPSPSAHGG